MDVEGEWKNEQTVARLWVGYMWKGPIVTIVLFTTHVPVFFGLAGIILEILS